MKILIICPDGLSTLIFCKTLCRILSEDYGYNVFTMSPEGLYKSELSKLDSTHLPIKMCRWISPYNDVVYLNSIYKIIKREKFDQVLTFTTKPNIYGVVAAKLAGAPKVTMAIRGLGQVFNRKSGLKSQILYRLVSVLYRIACMSANHVWFTNILDQRFFIENKIMDEKKGFLTKNAVDLNIFSMDAIDKVNVQKLKKELGITDRSKVVIMVARLIWSKGIAEFCEAALSFNDSGSDIKFILVAPEESGSFEAVPVSYINNIEANSNLTWLGFRKDVRDLYAVTDLSVLPSYYKEGGYPRALLEAMALGKPVIAADTPDCKGPVDEGKNGYLVTPRDANSLTEAITKVFEDEERLRQFGNHSLKLIRQDFDDKKVVREVISTLIS